MKTPKCYFQRHFAVCAFLFHLFLILFVCCNHNHTTAYKLPIFKDIKPQTSQWACYSGVNPNHKWYLSYGNVCIDSSHVYKGSRTILLEDSTEIYYQFVPETEGDSVCFSGKYMFQKGNDTKIEFVIRQTDQKNDSTQTIIFENTPDKNGWHSFKVKTNIIEYVSDIHLLIRSQGKSKLWACDLSASIDGKSIKREGPELGKSRFEDGSEIKLTALNTFQIENLKTLCKILSS